MSRGADAIKQYAEDSVLLRAFEILYYRNHCKVNGIPYKYHPYGIRSDQPLINLFYSLAEELKEGIALHPTEAKIVNKLFDKGIIRSVDGYKHVNEIPKKDYISVEDEL